MEVLCDAPCSVVSLLLAGLLDCFYVLCLVLLLPLLLLAVFVGSRHW
jgi:hypothetical protein